MKVESIQTRGWTLLYSAVCGGFGADPARSAAVIADAKLLLHALASGQSKKKYTTDKVFDLLSPLSTFGQTDKHYQKCSCKVSFIKGKKRCCRRVASFASIFTDFLCFPQRKRSSTTVIFPLVVSCYRPSFCPNFKSNYWTICPGRTFCRLFQSLRIRGPGKFSKILRSLTSAPLQLFRRAAWPFLTRLNERIKRSAHKRALHVSAFKLRNGRPTNWNDSLLYSASSLATVLTHRPVRNRQEHQRHYKI